MSHERILTASQEQPPDETITSKPFSKSLSFGLLLIEEWNWMNLKLNNNIIIILWK